MSLLEVCDLSVRYGSATVVQDISFSVGRGESVGMVGSSGSGKSQTAMALLGLLGDDASVSGSVKLAGEEMLGANNTTLNRVRARRVGFVFQDPSQSLNPYVRIGKQLRQVLLSHNLADRASADARVEAMLERVGLPDPARQKRAFSHELSGGMQQRVMIAAALIAEPDLLIADEPTTALDVTVQAQVLALLEDLREDTALLLITHDLGVVAGHCERLVVVDEGRVVESGPTASVFAAPQQVATKKLLDAATRLDRKAPPVNPVSTTLLDVERAAVSFRDSDKRTMLAVRDISLTLREAETLAVVGESGSGKTSLMRAILGLVPMTGGRVVYAGAPLQGEVATRTLLQRRNLQLVFQDPSASLNPAMRVKDIVAEPLRTQESGLSARDTAARVNDALQGVGLDESFLVRFPHQLSGGQAQRVAIARALILRPKILICDEAVAALDGEVQQQILELLVAEQRANGLSIIFITHDLAVVRAHCHRTAVLYLGCLLEVANSEALFARPRHPYTRALIDAVPTPDPTVKAKPSPLSGEIPSPLNPPAGCVFHPRCRYAVKDCTSKVPALHDVGGTQVACHRAAELNLGV